MIDSKTAKNIAVYGGIGLLALYAMKKLNLSDMLGKGLGDLLGNGIAGLGSVLGGAIGGVVSGAVHGFENLGIAEISALGFKSQAENAKEAFNQYGTVKTIETTYATLYNPMAWFDPKAGAAYKLVAPAEVINAQYQPTAVNNIFDNPGAYNFLNNLTKSGKYTGAQELAIMNKRYGLPYNAANLPSGY